MSDPKELLDRSAVYEQVAIGDEVLIPVALVKELRRSLSHALAEFPWLEQLQEIIAQRDALQEENARLRREIDDTPI